MSFRTLSNANLSGKTALVRVDLNLPMKDGSATDLTRAAAHHPGRVLELGRCPHRAAAVAHPGPGGFVARNAHDVAGAAAVERTAQGDVERDQLQRGALDDSEGANEAAQSASGVPIWAGAGHRSGACEAQAVNEDQACDDGFFCSENTICQAGQCTGGTPLCATRPRPLETLAGQLVAGVVQW